MEEIKNVVPDLETMTPEQIEEWNIDQALKAQTQQEVEAIEREDFDKYTTFTNYTVTVPNPNAETDGIESLVFKKDGESTLDEVIAAVTDFVKECLLVEEIEKEEIEGFILCCGIWDELTVSMKLDDVLLDLRFDDALTRHTATSRALLLELAEGQEVKDAEEGKIIVPQSYVPTLLHILEENARA